MIQFHSPSRLFHPRVRVIKQRPRFHLGPGRSQKEQADDRFGTEDGILDGLSAKSREALRRHVRHVHLARPDVRYDELTGVLPLIGAVPKATVIELFFRRTIGHTPIEPFVCGTYTNYLQTAPHLQTIISKSKICHCLQ